MKAADPNLVADTRDRRRERLQDAAQEIDWNESLRAKLAHEPTTGKARSALVAALTETVRARLKGQHDGNQDAYEPPESDVSTALLAALDERHAKLKEIAAADVRERETNGKLKAEGKLPFADQVDAINTANHEFTHSQSFEGAHANWTRADATRKAVVAEAARLLRLNPHMSKSAAAKLIGKNTDIDCRAARARDILKQYKADDLRKLEEAV